MALGITLSACRAPIPSNGTPRETTAARVEASPEVQVDGQAARSLVDVRPAEPPYVAELDAALEAGAVASAWSEELRLYRLRAGGPSLLCVASDPSREPTAWSCTTLPWQAIEWTRPPRTVDGLPSPSHAALTLAAEGSSADEGTVSVQARRLALVDASGVGHHVAVFLTQAGARWLDLGPFAPEPRVAPDRRPDRPAWFPSETSNVRAGLYLDDDGGDVSEADAEDEERTDGDTPNDPYFTSLWSRSAAVAGAVPPRRPDGSVWPSMHSVETSEETLSVWYAAPEPNEDDFGAHRICHRVEPAPTVRCVELEPDSHPDDMIVDAPLFAFLLQERDVDALGLVWQRVEYGGSGDGSGGTGDARVVVLDRPTSAWWPPLSIGQVQFENRRVSVDDLPTDSACADALARLVYEQNGGPRGSRPPEGWLERLSHFERHVERSLLGIRDVSPRGFVLGPPERETVDTREDFVRLRRAPDLLARALATPACRATRREMDASADEFERFEGSYDDGDAATGDDDASAPAGDERGATPLARPGRYVLGRRGLLRR